MAIEFDKDAMRRQFHELGRKREEIMGQSAPLRAQADALGAKISELRAQRKPLVAQVKEVEKDLFEIDNDRAQLARILGRKTGKPEDYA